MFNALDEVKKFYKENNPQKIKIIYDEFKTNLDTLPILNEHWNKTEGFGDKQFSWNWQLIVQEMPQNFKFLEIGVYKGRILSLIELLSKLQNKNAKIYGVTPLDNIGDKYSRYEQDDFYRAIKNGFNALNLDMTNVEIITGLSQDFHVLEKVKSQSFFDIIFIDGSHDYEVVCQDVLNYVPYLKKGGYLVMDDASFYVENMPYGIFKGHPDVGKAVIDIIDKDKELEELYICGHNRVWIKL